MSGLDGLGWPNPEDEFTQQLDKFEKQIHASAVLATVKILDQMNPATVREAYELWERKNLKYDPNSELVPDFVIRAAIDIKTWAEVSGKKDFSICGLRYRKH